VSHNQPTDTRNLIINSLPPAERETLLASLERVPLERGDVLTRTHDPIDHMYFIEGGVVSMTSLSADGERTEIGVIGYEGMVGLSRVLGSERAPHETFVQIGEAHALRIDVSRFAVAMDQSHCLRQLVHRLIHISMVQMSQSAVAYARFHIEGRLARWLLLCRDRTETDELKLTHEFMAAMIGAQRSGVTLALHELEIAGMISSARGIVTIVDREKLLYLAGDSYGLAESEYRSLIAPFGLASPA
jgi:CRP-like cAMP-binding protein